MTSLKTISILLLLVVFNSSCSSTKTPIALHDIWAATHINETPILTTENRPNLEINVTEMKIFGTDGCNNYTGNIKKLTSKNIAFGPLASTRKICLDMQIPDAYNQALNKAVSYKKELLNLYFFDSEGHKILSFKKVD